MHDLLLRLESNFIELAILLHDIVPNSLMEDVEFFIMEPHMSSNCRTNTALSFRLGGLTAKTTGANALLIGALYMLFNAKDGMIKGYPQSEIIKSLDRVDAFIKTANDWRLTELNY